jgi:DoxX-like family
VTAPIGTGRPSRSSGAGQWSRQAPVVPRAWLPALALLKAAGGAGLLLGLLGAKPLGLAAGTALVLFYVGAVLAPTTG